MCEKHKNQKKRKDISLIFKGDYNRVIIDMESLSKLQTHQNSHQINNFVVPQNFPSHFTQEMFLDFLKLLKVDQELIRQILLLSNEPLTRVSLFIKMCELQRYQMFSIVLICL